MSYYELSRMNGLSAKAKDILTSVDRVARQIEKSSGTPPTHITISIAQKTLITNALDKALKKNKKEIDRSFALKFRGVLLDVKKGTLVDVYA